MRSSNPKIPVCQNVSDSLLYSRLIIMPFPFSFLDLLGSKGFGASPKGLHIRVRSQTTIIIISINIVISHLLSTYKHCLLYSLFNTHKVLEISIIAILEQKV